MSQGTILITGASSGIGAALAQHYAKAGHHLVLTGRDKSRLEDVATSCCAKGATVEAHCLDVTDQLAMAQLFGDVDRRHPLDLVIANAGISAGTGDGGESPEQARRITQTNVAGVMNSVLPAIALMRPRQRGQLALISSLAAFRGFPGAPAYCASKAWVKSWGEALRGELAAEGIAVTVVCPGFVKSRMTAVNKFPMPFLWDTGRAARHIARGIARRRSRIAFPFPLYFLVWLLGSLPPWMSDWLFQRLPRKGS